MNSDILFARPSFLNGVARTIDLRGSFTEYNVSASPQEADARAMYSDWRSVGEALVSAAAAVIRDPAQLELFSSKEK